MATYKVLQDIEADDKLFGPFSLKQFIFAGIAIGFGVAAFFIATSPIPIVFKIPMVVALLPPMALFGFLAAPLSHDQTAEVWLLARISFLFRPRKRIWNQDGINNLVTITAPKRDTHVYTNSLSQTEVRSRLQALANTVDSRGWAIKNVNTNLFAQPGYLNDDGGSDRLIDPMSLPQEVPITDITAADDMLDESNSTAERLDQLVQQSTTSHREQAVSAMKPEENATPADYWFMNQTEAPTTKSVPSGMSTFQSRQTVAPGTADAHPAAEETEEEKALAAKIISEQNQAKARVSDHMKVLQPIHNDSGQLIQPPQPSAQLTPVDPYASLAGLPQDQPTPNPAILSLASNDDLNVSTIANEAKRLSKDDGEVVISLH